MISRVEWFDFLAAFVILAGVGGVKDQNFLVCYNMMLMKHKFMNSVEQSPDLGLWYNVHQICQTFGSAKYNSVLCT